MKVGEILEMYNGRYRDVEYYRMRNPGDRYARMHSDYIESVDTWVPETAEAEGYSLMDEAEYNASLCANSCTNADFGCWYGDPSVKVLVIVLRHDWEEDTGTDETAGPDPQALRLAEEIVGLPGWDGENVPEVLATTCSADRLRDILDSYTTEFGSPKYDGTPLELTPELEKKISPLTKAQMKYEKTHIVRVGLKLNRRTDADILEWLDGQDNRQGAIKGAIRTVIGRNDRQ